MSMVSGMQLRFEFDNYQDNIRIEPIGFTDSEWDGFIRIISDYSSAILQLDGKLFIPYRVFLGIRSEIAQYLRNHSIGTSFSPKVRDILKQANTKSYSSALKASDLTEVEVQEKLLAAGFTRKLTDNQMKNVCHLASLPAGATFSVPGAGKTTEALAYFFCNAKAEDHLLVVGPLSAMGAWETQIDECCPDQGYTFTRLRGGEKNVDRLLRDNPRFMLISYGQFATVAHLVRQYLAYHPVIMFLDESHRIKSGRSGVSPQEILNVSYLPEKKLILSGTPCPQSISDLLPQFEFLYPDRFVNEDTVVDSLQPVYVRTTKGQLGIPAVNHRKISLEMTPLQREVYKALRSETKRQMLAMLSDSEKYSLRDIGKKVMKVMEFTSNPSLLADDMDYIFDKRLGDLLSVDSGPKIEYACQRARELAAEGKKVIIWSQFVKNVLLLTERLKDIGADCIYGGVNSGDEDEEDTREWKIKQFHENDEKMVLVLNPSAASEAISLHKACQHAIYVDRSFNAAHYLQSEDRIHRLGLAPDQHPIVEIVECRGTIDEVIDQRLKLKVSTMAAALNDTSLNVESIPYDIDFSIEDMNGDDIQAVIDYFFGDD